MTDAHPDSIAAQLARRDPTGIYSDWVHVGIDSYHDRRTAYLFSVNPVGVKRDAFEYNDNSEDANWDAVWDVATSIDSTGWTAEYRIPLSQLRFSSIDSDAERTWGFEVLRDVARRNERDAWAPWRPEDNALVSRFGDLTGLVGVRAAVHAELLPYVSNKLTYSPVEAGNPFRGASQTAPAVGLDFKMALPKGMTLTGTVNPDFGQVEVDPEVVNLSAFETFFPEKRPFFVEGSGIFDFGHTRNYNNYLYQQFFYSRRIGRPPTRSISAAFVDEPDETPIATAMKLSGKNGPWTVGVLDAVTPGENARFRLTPTGVNDRAVVEPLSNYFVGRIRRDFNDGQTIVGSMLTSTDRSLGDSTLATILPRRATFGGFDFDHSWHKGLWYLTGYAAGSHAEGNPESIAAAQRSSAHYFQRPDARYLHLDSTRAGMDGASAEISLQHTGAWAGSVDYRTLTPGFELNDLGYSQRSDYHALSSIVGYQSFSASRLLRAFSDVLYANHVWNYGGNLIYDGYATSFSGTFTNFWYGNAAFTVVPSALDDRATRGGPLLRAPDVRVFNAGLGSDTRRMITAHYGGSFEWDGVGGGHQQSHQVSLSMRPASNVLVTFGPTLASTAASHQYVTRIADPSATGTFGARYVMARLDQTTLSADTRLNWTFTPTLSLQLYAQPFVSAGRFSNFKELSRPASADFLVYGSGVSRINYDATTRVYSVDPDGPGPAPAFTIANPDFNVRSLRGNAVLRWEYRPGSALFVVWQQQRAGTEAVGDFDFSRDVQGIFREPMTNVLLIKATYWIGI